MSITVKAISSNTSKTAKPKDKTAWSLSVGKTLTDKRRVQFYKDFYMLLHAKVDFKTALTILVAQQKHPKTKTLLQSLLDQVVAGRMFFEAISDSGEFSDYEIFSIKIGEQTRQLAEVLQELQSYFDKKVALRKQIISILTYPAFVLLLTLCTLYFMLNYVVPLFGSVFNQFDKDLPALTQAVINLADNFNTILLITLVTVAAIYLGYRQARKRAAFRAFQAELILKIPFFGRLVREIYLTRFCQTMALLLRSKTSILESIALVRNIVGFHPIATALKTAETDLMRGIPLSESLRKFKVFDHQLISMVQVAEGVNQLDEMFATLGEQYNTEVSYKTKIMGTVIEPLLILFIGSIVGLIMIAMYAPMFNLSEVLGGA
ncbi:type II secretion system F family protein [Gilvibacter sp.]|uniref:type II secretion system F family protein n=1 Tax=Gilvibacter sp. TaxID=2729997 RepID=UPI003F49B9E2